MQDMYRTSNSRKNSEDEAPGQADVNSPQIRTDVTAKSHESLIEICFENNQSILNENEKTDSSKLVVDGQTPELKSERPKNLTSDTVANGKQHQKTTKKEKGYSRSKDTQRKTSTKDNLMDDSGTFAVDIAS